MKKIKTQVTDELESDDEVSLKTQLSFYIPLIFTSILMMTTHSLMNAALSRLPAPAIYLSAYAVSKSVMLVLKSPIVMVRQTVSSLVEDEESYKKVKKFIMIGVTIIVLLLALVALTKIGYWIFKNIMGLRGKTLIKAVAILRIFILFPVVSTLRNFMHGLSIKYQATPLFTIATIFRIIYVGTIVIYMDKIAQYIPGSFIAGFLFLGALTIEALVMFIGVKLIVGDIKGNLDQIKQNKINESKKVTNDLNYKMIFMFFYPLAITSIMKFLISPVVNMGLARTARPEIAISAYAVGWYLGLIFMSPLFMFHQVPINFMGDNGNNNLNSIKKFGLILATVMTIVFLIISFTGIGYYILRNLIGATVEISKMALDVLKIMTVYPFIRVAREYYWGVLLKKHETTYISKGKVIGLTTLTIMIIFLTIIEPSNPAIIGVISLICSQITESLYLFLVNRRGNKALIRG